ncbi:MAG: CRISPR-associated protein Cas4 [Bacteroidota bacterium]
MFTEDDFIQLSALQHYVFCPRQCALIHVEGAWDENVYTVRGDILHEKVDTDTYETRGAARTVRGLRIHSVRLGIVGRADVVEFYKTRDGSSSVFPVEFKSGGPKHDVSDEVQLCAQALCLEEMLKTEVRSGAFFYGRIRRRVQVELDEALRSQTEDIIASVRGIVSRKQVPTLSDVAEGAGISAAQFMKRCKHCSLENVCQPKAMNERKLRHYVSMLYTP